MKHTGERPYQPRRIWLAFVGIVLGVLFCKVTEFITLDLRVFRMCLPKVARNLETKIYRSQHAEAL